MHVGAEQWIYGAVFAAAMLISLFAWLKGDRPARLAGFAYGLCWLIGTVAIVVSAVGRGQFQQPTGLAMATNAATAAAFLYLTLRYNSPWLCAALVAQGGQLGLNVVRRTEGVSTGILLPQLLLGGMFVLELAIMACLAGATLSAMARRRRAQAAQAA